MSNIKLFLVFIIIAGLLFSPLLYSKAYSKSDITAIPTINITPKSKPPIFSTPPVVENSFCSGSICLPPGETPASLNLNHLSINSSRDVYSTTVNNKDGTAPMTGTYNIPVLMVKFPDLQAPSNYTQSIYNDVFNSSNYLNGDGISVSEFYKHNSFDALDVTFDVYDWRMLPQTHTYYLTHTHQLVVDSINAFGTGPNAIDFTQYDSNNDGRLDGVIILQAGYQGQENNGSLISLTRMYYGSTTWSIQGLYYGDTAIIPARHVTNICNGWISLFDYPTDCRTSIEIATHEFAHILGLPDLYALNYTGIQVGFGLGGHTVMVLNGDTTQDTKKPVNFDTWSKFFFGWITPTVINDASQADIYSLSSYDTTDDVYLLQNTSTMGSREFYLISNRYISDTSLDRYLFGIVPPTFNVHGGLDILHVDENYIDQTYAGPIAFNSVMFDPDGDYYDDNLSHPGIVFEQNILDPISPPARGFSDDYTTELPAPGICDSIVFEGKFDDIERHSIPASCPIYRDTTSNSYLTLQNSGIKVYGWSDSGSTIEGYFTVDTPLDLVATVISPNDGDDFNLTDTIDFNSSVENSIGDYNCEWKYKLPGPNPFTVFSTDCNLSATPSSIGMIDGNYSVYFTATDELDRTESDYVGITILYSDIFFNEILSPVEDQSYPYKELVDFNAVYYNNQGDVTCEWQADGEVISNDCNFSDTPFNLGLTSMSPVSGVNTVIPSIFYTQKSTVASPLFTKKVTINNSFVKVSNDFTSSSRNLNYVGYFPANYDRNITLTTTDDFSSYTTSMTMHVCMCMTAIKQNYLPY